MTLPQAGAEEVSEAPQAAARKEPLKEKTPRVDWAELLRRAFDFNVFACVRCGGRLKLFKLAHPRTLRRWWLHLPVDLYLSDKALFVVLRPRWLREWWQQKVEHLNARKIRVPWLGERLVLYSLGTPSGAEPPNEPSAASQGVWC